MHCLEGGADCNLCGGQWLLLHKGQSPFLLCIYSNKSDIYCTHYYHAIHYLGDGIADVLQPPGTSSHYFPCIAGMSLAEQRICNMQENAAQDGWKTC